MTNFARQLTAVLLALGLTHDVTLANRGDPPQAQREEAPPARVVASREQLTHARELAAQADFAGARAAIARAAEPILSGAAGSITREEVALLSDLRKLAAQVGDVRLAFTAAERIVRETEASWPTDEVLGNEARANLARAYLGLGDDASARPILERVIAAYERTPPADVLELPKLRLNLARVLAVSGDVRGARGLQETTLAALESELPDDDTLVTAARASLAESLRILGEFARARELQVRVVEMHARVASADPIGLAQARGNLAVTLLAMGDHADAREMFEQAAPVFESLLPPDHLDLAILWNSLASCAFAVGDLPTARALFERTVATFERALPAGHPDLLGVRQNLAAVLSRQGDVPAARALLEKVIEDARALPADHVDAVSARRNLAAILLELGDFAGARALHEEAVLALERTLPPDDPLLAGARASLARSLTQMGDDAAARVLVERAIADYERLSPDHPHLLTVRWLQALIADRANESAEARRILEGVLATAERTLPAGHSVISGVATDLAGMLVAIAATQSPDADGATRAAWESVAIRLARNLRASALAAVFESSPREVEDRLSALNWRIEHVFSLALGCAIAEPDLEIAAEAFQASESSRSGALVAARLASSDTDVDGTRVRRARVAAATQELTRLAQSGESETAVVAARVEVDAAGRDLAEHANKSLDRSAMEPTVAALARRLDSGMALVAWRKATLARTSRGARPTFDHVESLVACVLRPGETSTDGRSSAPRFTCVDLGPIDVVRTVAEGWRDAIGVSRDRGLAVADAAEKARNLAEELRALVLDPLRGALTGVERILAVPDDALHAIPLDALPAGDAWTPAGARDQLLGDVIRIDTLASSMELLIPRLPTAGDAILVAFGHPAFDADPETSGDTQVELAALEPEPRAADRAGLLRATMWERGFATLPETRAEVRGIAQYFEDAFGAEAPVTVNERSRASRDALFEIGPRARWLHVATHGWFAPESVSSSADTESTRALDGFRMDATERLRGMNPMLLCGLALAGANRPINSVGRIPGLVTAQEIAALDLSNCELAVLSACDTNVGIRRAGQGVSSLQRALSMAGARSVITSLWKVPDEATKDLMLDFYRRLWIEKKPKHVALWEAKRKLRRAVDASGAPLHATRDWAAWVLTGESD